jgi:GT2 family glycosyltransferase
MGSSRVAVVVITRDRADELLRALGRLTALPERPQVVVVDQGSRDGTAARVRERFPGVRLIALAGNRGAAGRTLGVRAVDAPYVAFADDDSWWEPGALARAEALLDAHPALALVAGRILLGPERRLERACAQMAASPLPPEPGVPGPRVLGFVACGAVVRRSAFLAAGGFHDRAGIGGEEELLAAELAARGWQLVYRADVVAHHHPSPVRDRARRRALLTRNRLWFAWLRRRRRAALRITLAEAAAAARDPAARAGVMRALAGARWVLAARRPVPKWLEADLRLLELS